MKLKESEEIFKEAYSQHFRQIMFYCNHFLRDIEQAEEIAQDVFMSLWERRDEVNFEKDIAPYIFTIAKRKCLNVIKRRKHINDHKSYVGSKYSDEVLSMYSLSNSNFEKLMGNEANAILNKSLKEMPEKTSKAFSLSKLEGVTNKRIAEIQNCSTKNIEYRMNTAMKILRKNFKDYFIIILGFLLT